MGPRGMRMAVEKAHNGELHSLYRLSNIVRANKYRLRWAAHVARMQDGRIAFEMLTDKRTGDTFRKP